MEMIRKRKKSLHLLLRHPPKLPAATDGSSHRRRITAIQGHSFPGEFAEPTGGIWRMPLIGQFVILLTGSPIWPSLPLDLIAH